MKPICFPSTFVSDSVARALTACFGKFIVYQPLAGEIPEQMRPWVEKGILDIRVPMIENQETIEATVKNYLSWANLHFGGSGLKPPFLKNWKNAMPFFNDSASSQIAADIKKRVHDIPGSKAEQPFSAARIFLYFAQEFDRQNHEIVRDLQRQRQQEAELIRQLKMEDDALTAEFQKERVQIPDDSANYMVFDRLEAWTRILLSDTDISGLFITHIPAVLQELLDRTPTAEKLLALESIPTSGALTAELAPWRQKLMSDLAHIANHKWVSTIDRLPDQPSFPAEANSVSLSVYLAPDQMPRDFFSRCAQIQPSGRDACLPGDRFKNTLIGLIEF